MKSEECWDSARWEHTEQYCPDDVTTGYQSKQVGWKDFTVDLQARYDLFCVKNAVKPQPTITVD